MPEAFKEIVQKYWERIHSLLYTPISNQMFITFKDRTEIELGVHSAYIKYPNGDCTAVRLIDLGEKL